eukprot:59666-Pyramimonas_sp.AAC.2
MLLTAQSCTAPLICPHSNTTPPLGATIGSPAVYHAGDPVRERGTAERARIGVVTGHSRARVPAGRSQSKLTRIAHQG